MADAFDMAYWYDCDDGAERLSFSDVNDAIEYHLDQTLDLFEVPASKVLAQIEEMGEVTVYAFCRTPMAPNVSANLVNRLLESAIESLDEEYGDPENSADHTPAMRESARVFVDAILRDYKVWTCEKVAERTFDVEAWVREHRPDWLEDPTNA